MQALLVAGWLAATVEVVRHLGTGPLGIAVAAGWPLVPFGLFFAVVWVRGARHRRRLIAQEWRD